MFYYHRYESHHNAMKIADEQRRNAERKSSDILDLFQVPSKIALSFFPLFPFFSIDFFFGRSVRKILNS